MHAAHTESNWIKKQMTESTRSCLSGKTFKNPGIWLLISLIAFSQHVVCPIFFKAIVFSTTLLSSSAVSGTQDSFNHCTQSGDICCHKRTECDTHPFHPTQNALTSTEMCVAVLYLPESAFTFLQLTTHNPHMFNTVASSQTVQCTSKTNLWPPIMQSSFF